MYQEVLKDVGLDNKEPIVYDTLLHLGPSPAQEIIKHSNLKRGIVYKTLEELEKKALVTSYKKNKKKYFKLEHPYKLAEIVETSVQKAESQKLSLQAQLPQLISAFNVTENRPGVKVFEGINGIKDIYEDTLRDKHEIWAVLQTAEVDPKIYKWLNNNYGPRRAEAGIWARVILADDKGTKEYIDLNEEQKRETRVVPKEDFPVAIEMNIYGNKVAFINFKEGEPLMGVIIHNKLIADTMRAVHSLAWKQAEHYTHNTYESDTL